MEEWVGGSGVYTNVQVCANMICTTVNSHCWPLMVIITIFPDIFIQDSNLDRPCPCPQSTGLCSAAGCGIKQKHVFPPGVYGPIFPPAVTDAPPCHSKCPGPHCPIKANTMDLFSFYHPAPMLKAKPELNPSIVLLVQSLLSVFAHH